MRPPGLKPDLITAFDAALKRRSSTALPAFYGAEKFFHGFSLKEIRLRWRVLSAG
jgi:hypothetical protein